ncbi:hypothetical protein HW115_19200 [Verrucomicrobiaceae bacterium N1E253]|uniref:Uncharacterized protein n=1 Tax=Oceaniferula marina TaxID=2748318 RepID=A0A851GTV9_9BACT|nr:hypothetical protein [Oceaniferula marina]NWK57754.1 hypothetical protein [Oceaniferula marina]
MKANDHQCFIDSLTQILDSLDASFDVNCRSASLDAYIKHCRLFCCEGVIPNYPDWLSGLRKIGNSIAPRIPNSKLRQIAQSVTKLIEDASYGEPEKYHFDEINRISVAAAKLRCNQ